MQFRYRCRHWTLHWPTDKTFGLWDLVLPFDMLLTTHKNVPQAENFCREELMTHCHTLYPAQVKAPDWYSCCQYLPASPGTVRGNEVRKGPAMHHLLGESSGTCSKFGCLNNTLIESSHCFCHYLYSYCFLYLPRHIFAHKIFLPFVKYFSVILKYTIESIIIWTCLNALVNTDSFLWDTSAVKLWCWRCKNLGLCLFIAGSPSSSFAGIRQVGTVLEERCNATLSVRFK